MFVTEPSVGLEESEETLDCSSCVFIEEEPEEMEELEELEEGEEEEPGLNCSLVLLSSHCKYCNTSSQCHRGLCRHITKVTPPTITHTT